MKNTNQADIEGYTCFKILRETNEKIAAVKNATVNCDSLEIIPIKYPVDDKDNGEETVYFAGGKLGTHTINVSMELELNQS